MTEDLISNKPEKSLVDRAKAILLKPQEEWPAIATETTSTTQLLTRYVLPLAAIGPVAAFIGGQLFGFGGFGFSIKPSFTGALSTMLVGYIMAIVGFFVVAFLANFIAGKFDGETNNSQAQKLVAYSFTAAWLAGIFSLIPSISWLGILGLYSIYLFYTGAAPLMKIPQEKTIAYTAVTFIAGIIVFLLAGFLTSGLAGAFGGGAVQFGHVANSDDASGTINVPGVGSIDVGKAQDTADRMEKMAKGEIKPVDAAQMRELLPENLGGYKRVSIETSAMAGMGSQAEAVFESGDNRIDLKIIDTFAMGGMAGIAAAMNIEREKEDENGYERIRRDGNRTVVEEWDYSSSRGRYGLFFGDRFMVEAKGKAANIGELKSAVEQIDPNDLAGLAR